MVARIGLNSDLPIDLWRIGQDGRVPELRSWQRPADAGQRSIVDQRARSAQLIVRGEVRGPATRSISNSPRHGLSPVALQIAYHVPLMSDTIAKALVRVSLLAAAMALLLIVLLAATVRATNNIESPFTSGLIVLVLLGGPLLTLAGLLFGIAILRRSRRYRRTGLLATLVNVVILLVLVVVDVALLGCAIRGC